MDENMTTEVQEVSTTEVSAEETTKKDIDLKGGLIAGGGACALALGIGIWRNHKAKKEGRPYRKLAFHLPVSLEKVGPEKSESTTESTTEQK